MRGGELRGALAAAALFTLAACGPSAAEKASWTAEASRPVICRGPSDCAVKWGRALEWVELYSAYPLRIANDRVIETGGPGEDDPRPAYTILKTARGDGSYRIEFDGGCANLIGCVPPVLQAEANFVDYVLGPAGD